MSLTTFDSPNLPEGLDPRVRAMLEERPEEWFEDVFGFGRARQALRDQRGYETTEAYEARTSGNGDLISWTWLEDIGLIANEGRAPIESEKQRGLSILREHLDELAHRLGEID